MLAISQLLIEHLKLKDITLVVHDFGGPVGLSYAIETSWQREADRDLEYLHVVARRETGHFELPAKLFNNPLGRFAYKSLNFSPSGHAPVWRGAISRSSPKAVHRHYIQGFIILPLSARELGCFCKS
jgi:pimeloyl-ACP methyl ester carboxylesterase